MTKRKFDLLLMQYKQFNTHYQLSGCFVATQSLQQYHSKEVHSQRYFFLSFNLLADQVTLHGSSFDVLSTAQKQRSWLLDTLNHKRFEHRGTPSMRSLFSASEL
jgi:hypothetical protein